jgi:hypothetical protein
VDHVRVLRLPAFLPAAAAASGLDDLIRRRADFRARGVTADGRPRFYRLAAPLSSWPTFERRFAVLVPALEQHFKTSLRGARLELLPQAYSDGGAFARHSDAAAGGPNWQRRVSGVYYLHREPRRFTGGALALYDERGRAHSVEPDHNTVVFFPRDLEHEVLPVTCPSREFENSRFSITLWIG